MNKPREFWIAQTVDQDIIARTDVGLWASMGDWDKENTERIQVIEKSAADKLVKILEFFELPHEVKTRTKQESDYWANQFVIAMEITRKALKEYRGEND